LAQLASWSTLQNNKDFRARYQSAHKHTPNRSTSDAILGWIDG